MRTTIARIRCLAFVVVVALVATACGSSGDVAGEPVDAAANAEELVASADGADDASEAVATTTVAPTADAAEQAPVEEDVVEDDPIAESDAETDRAVLVEDLTSALVSWQESGGIPGASLSVRLPDQEPINIAVGVADLITEEPVDVDDYFRIGSITKPMTSAIVLQLVEEGLLELDEPVETYLPGWLTGYRYAGDITVRQLMDHTNGLVEYALSPEFFALGGQRLDKALTTDEIREWLAAQEPLFAPGTQYQYETGGFLTLGDVIEAVTGNSAAAEMRSRIFEPAGAENIFLTPEEFPPEPTVNAYGRAELYLASTLLIGRQDTEQLTINDEPVIDVLGQPQDVLQSAGWTGGGNEARLESVSAIMRAMFDGTILNDAQIAEMTSAVFDTNYGLGIDSRLIDDEIVYSHGGGVPGFRSQANYLPEHDVSWAVSANLLPLPEGSTVGDLRDVLQPILVAAAS